MDTTLFLVALSLLLLTARVLSQVCVRLGQPGVVGEIAAGVLLGPTVLGRLSPSVQGAVFPTDGETAAVMHGLNLVGIVLFLFMAGSEIDVASVGRRAKQAVAVAVGGMAVPLLVGFSGAWLAPAAFGWEGRADPRVFAFFIGTALCISALPVIAKTLMDLGLYRSDLGMTVIAAAVINDIVGWVLFAFILSTLPGSSSASGMFGGLMVVGSMVCLWLVGRPLLFRLLAEVHRRTSQPSAVLAVMVPLVFLGAALTEHFGVHAMLGAFAVGATAAGSPHFRERTRAALHDFVSVIFAPLFFASIGLYVDFVESFDLPVVLLVWLVASVGKVAGCVAGARVARVSAREAWAIGAAMNARGAMEIVLAAIALRVDLIGGRTFVALVLMALTTSMTSAPVIRRLFPKREPRRLLEVLHPETFVPALSARVPEAVIAELAAVAAPRAGIDAERIAELVIAREHLTTTALGRGIAVPHARIDGLVQTVAALGLSRDGVAFDAPDDVPVEAVVLVLTPSHDDGEQVEILADIARIFTAEPTRARLLQAETFDDVVEVLDTGLESRRRRRSAIRVIASQT